jgi:hypothetical protein
MYGCELSNKAFSIESVLGQQVDRQAGEDLEGSCPRRGF